MATLHFARMEAIKRGAHVVICESDGEDCTDHGDWAGGWIVFVDADRDGRFDGDGTPCEPGEDCLLLVQEPLEGGLTIRFNRGNRLTYLHSGWIRGFVGGRFTLCAQERGEYGRGVVLNAAGRVRLEEGIACPPSEG